MSDTIAVTTPLARPIQLRAWHHTSLAVSDLDTAICFYRDAFGFAPVFIVRAMDKQIARISGIQGLRCDLAELRLGHTQHVLELIAFHFPAADQLPVPDLMRGHVSFHVADLDQALALAQQHGAVMLGAITEFAEGRSVYCREPAGSLVELEEIWDASILEGGKP